MRSNRRSVLVVIGAAAAGCGAIFGTGAFSSAEANRTVTVDVDGDAAALLAFQIDGSFNGIADGGEAAGALEFRFADINKNAITTFSQVLEVTNNGTNTIDFEVTDAPGALTLEQGGTNLETASVEITANETVSVTIELDLVSFTETEAEGTVTFLAESV